MTAEESSDDEWESPNENKCVKELKCLGYFILLEHDITGLFVTTLNKLGAFRQKWNLKFTLERRLVHIIICILVTFTIQASFHVKNDLCIQRRRCHMDGCSVDYQTDQMLNSAASRLHRVDTRQTNDDEENTANEDTIQQSAHNTGEKNTVVESPTSQQGYQNCKPIPMSIVHIGSSNVEWFLYPKPTSFNSEQWSYCNSQAQAAAQPNTCSNGIVCLPACKSSQSSRTFAPDARPFCSSAQSSVLHGMSERNLEHTLVCVVPHLPCYSHEFSKDERRIIVAVSYQIVSFVVRLLLVCGCVHKPETRRRFRRLGYGLGITVVGLAAGIYAFELTEVTVFTTWIVDALISITGGMIIQVLWILIVNWFIVGSCSGRWCQAALRCLPSKPDSHFDHFKLSVMHTVRQVCGDRRRKAKRFESAFEGVMTIWGQKQLANKQTKVSSSSYDSVASEEWSEYSE